MLGPDGGVDEVVADVEVLTSTWDVLAVAASNDPPIVQTIGFANFPTGFIELETVGKPVHLSPCTNGNGSTVPR